eukprot:9104327-Ditylum_brightwellii.AAC.1
MVVQCCDNKTLVGRIKWYKRRIINNPTEYLHPNFDLQMAIKASVTELAVPYTCKHMCGHQNRGKPSQQSLQQSADLQTIFHQAQKKKKKLTWKA